MQVQNESEPGVRRSIRKHPLPAYKWSIETSRPLWIEINNIFQFGSAPGARPLSMVYHFASFIYKPFVYRWRIIFHNSRGGWSAFHSRYFGRVKCFSFVIIPNSHRLDIEVFIYKILLILPITEYSPAWPIILPHPLPFVTIKKSELLECPPPLCNATLFILFYMTLSMQRCKSYLPPPPQ